MRRWIFQESQAMPLAEWLRREQIGDQTVAPGSIFVNGHRVLDALQLLHPGDRIQLEMGREAAADGMIDVLDERPGLWVVAKPAGMSTEPDRRGSRGSLVESLARQLGEIPARLHALGRLDLPVSGLVVLANSKQARQQVLRARAQGEWRRFYLGLVLGTADPLEGVWSSQVDPAREVPAVTHYRTLLVGLQATQRVSLMCFELQTGHKHQLRVHCQRARVPLLGDRRYGGATRVSLRDGAVLSFNRVALHAWAFRALLEGQPWSVTCALAPELCTWWERLRGEAASLDTCDPELADLTGITDARLWESSSASAKKPV